MQPPQRCIVSLATGDLYRASDSTEGADWSKAGYCVWSDWTMKWERFEKPAAKSSSSEAKEIKLLT